MKNSEKLKYCYSIEHCMRCPNSESFCNFRKMCTMLKFEDSYNSDCLMLNYVIYDKKFIEDTLDTIFNAQSITFLKEILW